MHSRSLKFGERINPRSEMDARTELYADRNTVRKIKQVSLGQAFASAVRAPSG
jgi:hypothetical protein